jgi:hypothetical protein
MKISRWIYFPLFFVLIYVLPQIFLNRSINAKYLVYYAVLGAIVGFVTLLWGDARARKLTGQKGEEVYRVRQKRNLTLLLGYEKAFEVCRAAVNELKPAKVKEENLKSGIIKFRTPVRWDTFGHIITINLKKLNESLTEVEISTRPIPRTVIAGGGYSWKYTEEICNYLREKDAEINQKVLARSTVILEDIYVKPFQKEKVER